MLGAGRFETIVQKRLSNQNSKGIGGSERKLFHHALPVIADAWNSKGAVRNGGPQSPSFLPLQFSVIHSSSSFLYPSSHRSFLLISFHRPHHSSSPSILISSIFLLSSFLFCILPLHLLISIPHSSTSSISLSILLPSVHSFFLSSLA